MSEQVPSSYWVLGKVAKHRRIGSGADSTIYSGTLDGTNVAIREPHFPGDRGWDSPQGYSLLKVGGTHCLRQGWLTDSICYHLGDQTRTSLIGTRIFFPLP